MTDEQIAEMMQGMAELREQVKTLTAHAEATTKAVTKAAKPAPVTRDAFERMPAMERAGYIRAGGRIIV